MAASASAVLAAVRTGHGPPRGGADASDSRSSSCGGSAAGIYKEGKGVQGFRQSFNTINSMVNVSKYANAALDRTGHLAVDVRTIPWSHRGSYMSLSTLAGDCGLATPNIDVALVSQYKPYGGACFVMRPEVNPLPTPAGFHKSPSPVDFRAVPEKLEWLHGQDSVAQATFVDDRTIRLQGTVPMSFDTDMSVLRSYIYEPPRPVAGAFDVVEWSSIGLMPLRFIAVRGSLSTIGATTYEDGRITITPDEHGFYDLFIHERCPTADPSSTPGETTQEWAEAKLKTSFEHSVKRMRAEFREYVDGMCGWTSAPDQVDLLGSYVMWTSTVRAEGFVQTEAVLMSKLWMNKARCPRVVTDPR